MSCVECGSTKNLQVHHDSYNPQKTRKLCRKCHLKIHNHGVGLSKGEIPLLVYPNNICVCTRIKINTRKIIQKIISKDIQLNESTFIRAAIREKILRDAPYLIKEMLEEDEK